MSVNGLYVFLWCLAMLALAYYFYIRLKKVKQKQDQMLKQQKMLAQTIALKRAKKTTPK